MSRRQVILTKFRCIGNIAGDCDVCRERVVRSGCCAPLVNLLKRGEQNEELLITLGFSLCNILRGGKSRDELMKHGLLALVLRLLTPASAKDVVVEMTWVLAYISAGEDKYKVCFFG